MTAKPTSCKAFHSVPADSTMLINLKVKNEEIVLSKTVPKIPEQASELSVFHLIYVELPRRARAQREQRLGL
jgi:hypothetical protein